MAANIGRELLVSGGPLEPALGTGTMVHSA